MGDFGVVKDKWVCPNDRELSLRAKLKTGWSVKTNSINTFNKPASLNDAEQEVIMGVIKRAENLEKVEQERIGRLVERLENMKKNAMGNGSTQCVLCADEFGILGASPLLCNDCKKAVCTKCGVDTISAQKEPIWLCKICAETRETWKKSGAWFYKGLPKYILPGRKADHHHRYNAASPSRGDQTQSPQRSYNSWLQSKGKGTSEKENTDSSDEEFKSSRLAKRATVRKAYAEPDGNEALTVTTVAPPPDSAQGPSPTHLYSPAAMDPPRSPQHREDRARSPAHEVYSPYAKNKREESDRSQTPTATASHWSKTGARREAQEQDNHSDRQYRGQTRMDSQQPSANRHRSPATNMGRVDESYRGQASPEESSKRTFRKKKKRKK